MKQIVACRWNEEPTNDANRTEKRAKALKVLLLNGDWRQGWVVNGAGFAFFRLNFISQSQQRHERITLRRLKSSDLL